MGLYLRVNALFHGGKADGTTLVLEDLQEVWITMVDGTPKTIPDGPGDPDFDIMNRAARTWERYTRDDTDPHLDGPVLYRFDPPEHPPWSALG